MDTFFSKIKKYEIKEYDFASVKVGEQIGGGGFGSVYKCKVLGKDRACKRLYFEMGDSKVLNEFLCNLLHELILSTNLKSKRFTKVYGISYDKDNYELYIIMEILSDGDLKSYMEKNNVSLNKKVQIIRSLVLAVKEFHNQNCIHTDLKPENLTYNTDSKNKKYIKLLDYNLIARIKPGEEIIDGWDSTLGYSAPEQYDLKLCKKSDIHAIGVIFLELILGKSLWDNNIDNPKKIRISMLNNLEKLKKENEEIYKIIKRCVSKTATRRYSCEELLVALKAISLKL